MSISYCKLCNPCWASLGNAYESMTGYQMGSDMQSSIIGVILRCPMGLIRLNGSKVGSRKYPMGYLITIEWDNKSGSV